MIAWPDPDPRLEAEDEQSPRRRIQRAARAAREVVADFRRLERETTKQFLARLERLRAELQARLAQQLTDPQAPDLERLIRQVDTVIADATVDLVRAAERPARTAATLGMQAADLPMRAMQVAVTPELPGRDAALVAAADDNIIDLLTPPMRQFAAEIKTSLRRVAVAGAQRFEEIQRLQQVIGGQGFDNAQYRAERILRTEIGRVFGEATFARMTSLAQTFTFLRKAWIATKDSRTRAGHREAGQTYARGKGIPIADRFIVPVYQEGKMGTKRLGEAALRFPIDPLATPPGKLAAAATILCRCHAVVDVDPAAFAAFARAQVAVAFGQTPPAVPPAPPAPRRPRAPRKPRAPRVAPPSLAAGTPVSGAVNVGPRLTRVSRSLALIDRVHGDGPLPTVPAGPVEAHVRRRNPGVQAYYAYRPTGEAVRFGFGSRMLRELPHVGVFHEVGHFLDHQGLGRRQYASVAALTPGAASSVAYDGVREVFAALDQTPTLRTLRTWRLAALQQGGYAKGTGGVPRDIDLRSITYLLDQPEIFARAYSQYVALRSGHAPALAELGRMQQAAAPALAGVPSTAPRSRRSPWQPPDAGAWQYPWQWQDAEFAPVAAAFDRLFEALGWRKRNP